MLYEVITQVEYYQDIARSTKLGIVLHGHFSESLTIAMPKSMMRTSLSSYNFV